MTALTVERQRDRYVARRGSEVVGHVTYREREPGVEVLEHTEVAPELRGDGIAADLVERVLRGIGERGGRIVPSCPYIAHYLTRHPEHTGLVADDAAAS